MKESNLRKMKVSAWFGVLVFLPLWGVAQDVSLGFKALHDGNHARARIAFEEVLEVDPDDVAAHYGLSRYYSLASINNKERALDHLIQAEWNFPKGDEKARAELKKAGVSRVNLRERRNSLEKSFLADAQTENTVAAYNAFLERFPKSRSSSAALVLRNTKAYQDAQALGTVGALDEFIQEYPNTPEAARAIPERDAQAAEIALKGNTEESFRYFLDHYPQAQQAAMIEQRLYALAYQNAKAKSSSQALEMYIRDFPESIFLPQAVELRDALRKQGK